MCLYDTLISFFFFSSYANIYQTDSTYKSGFPPDFTFYNSTGASILPFRESVGRPHTAI